MLKQKTPSNDLIYVYDNVPYTNFEKKNMRNKIFTNNQNNQNSYNGRFVNFLIGFMLGIIFLFSIFLILYFTRTGTFQYCQVTPSLCSKYDYYNNPKDALRQGFELENLLSKKSGFLMYDRPKIETAKCNPGSNKQIIIDYPLYCMFEDQDGNASLWRDISFGRNNIQTSDYSYSITTQKNCVPEHEKFTKGNSVLFWD